MNTTGPLGPGQRMRLCVAVLAALAAAIVIVVATADGPDAISGSVGGDYPSFHAAGEIVRDDPGLDADVFYDPDLQADAQRAYLPPDDEGQLYFAYPVFFAAPYVAISAPGFSTGYLVHVSLMLLAIWATIRVLRPCNRIAREYPLETFTAAVTFYPLFRAVAGGQNTALTLLLTAIMWRALHDGHEGRCGVALGLLLFKPPFALPFVGVFLLTRRWRTLAVFAGTGAVLYGVGALLTDPSWPREWADAIRFLDEHDTPFNVHNFVSLPGAAEAVFGIDATAALVIGYGMAAVVSLAVAALWWRSRPGASSPPVPLDLLMAATALAGVLVSPHALFYDAGLLVLAGLALADRWPDRGGVLVVLWLAGAVHVAADALGASPLVLVVAVVALLVLREGWSRSREVDAEVVAR